ncbi:hypothetical protein [Bradyrhizobium centrosematis]|uniref:hypothetical protein n=1 Tax=Bradyrhizobium centrosematis TaxID=1300039 RepID=UPI0038906F3B
MIDQRIAVDQPMQTVDEHAVWNYAWIASVTSNAIKMLQARSYHIAFEWPETRNETFWIVVPAIGVTLLMAAIVFMIGS